MAEIATVARPYAEATFQAALQKNMLAAVCEGLALVAAIAHDAQMRSILTDPKVSARQKKELFNAIAGDLERRVREPRDQGAERRRIPQRRLRLERVDPGRGVDRPGVAQARRHEAVHRQRHLLERRPPRAHHTSGP